MNISIHFEGGLDTLFGNQKTIEISDLAAESTIASLLLYIGKNLIKGSVVLVLAIPALRSLMSNTETFLQSELNYF